MLLNLKIGELVDKFIMSFFKKNNEIAKDRKKTRNEQGETTNACYKKVLRIIRLLNLLHNEIDGFLVKK